MISLLGINRKWSGGLYFGAPGWTPAPESLPALAKGATTAPTPPLPKSLPALIELLTHLKLGATSAINPALLAQLRDLPAENAPPLRGIVLNLLPTQPESALPQTLIRQGLTELLAGLALIRQCVPAKRAYAVADRHDLRSRRTLRRSIRKLDLRVAKFLTTYPQSHPTLLLRTLAGKRLEPGVLPTSVGWLILDPTVCYLLGRYALTGAAPTHRPVQVFVKDKPPRLRMAAVGQTLSEFCAALRIGLLDQQIIVNGMMAGEVVDGGRKIDWATELVSIRPEPRLEMSTPCIQCGWCVDHCPTDLIPVRLYDLAIRGKVKAAEAAEARHCTGCGLCSYVCPTRLPLTSEILRLRDERGKGHE